MMDPFKIKVTDEVNNTKIQEALFELGCEWFGSTNEVKPLANCWIDVGSNGRLTWSFHGSDEKELTLPQLRDLAAKNKTVREFLEPQEDGAYKYVEWTCMTCPPEDYIEIPEGSEDYRSNNKFYKDSGVKFYSYKGEWLLSEQTGRHQILWKRPAKDPALISGADAMIAALEGKHVVWQWADGCGNWQAFNDEEWTVEDLKSDRYHFKIVPQTIKVELELPKPFEPKLGDEYFCINDSEVVGWTRYVCDEVVNPQDFNFGVWRTEEEIKQVVEQLRKIRGAP